MKQHWLIEPVPMNEPTLTLPLDPSAREELIDLMAAAIEIAFLLQVDELKNLGESIDE